MADTTEKSLQVMLPNMEVLFLNGLDYTSKILGEEMQIRCPSKLKVRTVEYCKNLLTIA